MPFAPTPAEVAFVNHIFTQADPQKLGVVTAEQGVKVFAGARLPPAILGDIWALADPENNGILTRKGVAIAVRLMGWAQKGEQPSNELLDKVGPLPVIDGVVVPAVSAPARAPAPITTLPSILPPLQSTDRTKFLSLFNKNNPIGGLLNGDAAKNVFVRSKLSVERLNAIWNLVDIQNRGSLDATQFVLAMYLIQGSMTANPTIPILPPSIPPFLWEQAGGRPPSVHSHTTGESLPSPTFQSSLSHKGFVPQYTGSSSIIPLNQQTTGGTQAMTPLTAQGTGSRMMPNIPSRPSNLGLGAQMTGGSPFPLARSPAAAQIPWDVTAEEKARNDGFFDSLDIAKAGYIEGAAAVPFMLLSNLPEDSLARIWDLADIKNDGRLTKETFAVAMHLINKVLEGKELPNVLSATLIPPSLRGNLGLSTASAPFSVLSQAQQDLLSLDEDISSPPVRAASPPPVISQISGYAFHSNFQSPSPAPAPAPVPTFGRDLLDDEEAEERQLKKTNDNNVEIANLRNQLSSTSTAQATVQHDRNQLEADLATSAATLTQIQTQLASAKIGYDTESKLLADLRERYTNQANEIKTTRDELIHAESDLSGLKLEKAEIGGNLLREKDDVRELKRRAAEIAQEVELIKKEIEQAKKDARMQKGLLAIAKKQLSTAEAEKEAAQKELAESKAEAEQAEAEVAQTEAAIATLKENTIVAPTSPPKVASPKPTGERDIATPGSPPVTSPILPFAESGRIASPTPSNSSRNPFDRFRQGSVSSLTTPQRSGSPFAAAHEPIAEAPKYSAEQDDPFGFNEPATEPPALILSPTIPTLTTGTETPRQQAAIPNGNLIAPMSPEQEKLISPAETFFTPPTSSAGNANIDDLFVDNNDTSASRFPALTDPISPTNDTDLPPLKDVVEEDSSSDEEDNRPLGEVKAEKQATAAISGGETQKHAPQESVNTGPSFDDVFGAPEPSAAATSATTTTAPNSHFSTLGSSAASPTTSAFNSQVAPPVINGHTTGNSAVDAFDHAMGTGPGVSTETKASNEFEFGEFGETFNFGDASFSHASRPSRDLKAPPTAAATTAIAAFDDAFGIPTSATAQPGTTVAAQPGLSFEDAFGVETTEPQSQPQFSQQPEAPVTFPLPESHGGSSPPPMAAATQNNLVQNGATKGTPSVRSGSPVATRESSSSLRPSSPLSSAASHQQQQQQIPAARPRPPKDAAKSGGSLAPEAAGPSRSSRLSIHFPFGRSKSSKDKKDKKEKDKHSKDHDKSESRPPMPPIPGSHSPSTDRLDEQPEIGTPTEDGDIPVLKQLMQLGFDRERSVEALEASSYNFQRALNKLLASS